MGPGPHAPWEAAAEMPELILFLMAILGVSVAVLGAYKLIDKFRGDHDG